MYELAKGAENGHERPEVSYIRDSAFSLVTSYLKLSGYGQLLIVALLKRKVPSPNSSIEDT